MRKQDFDEIGADGDGYITASELLTEVCGAFLPGRFWCPRDSKVVREVEIT